MQYLIQKKPILIMLLGFAISAAQAVQPLSKTDSGWVPLFNGKNFDGLYSRMYNKEVTTTIDPGFQIKFAGTDSVEIYVAGVGGEIGSQRTDYSHYRMRVQYRFEQAGNLNAGFLYAIDETYPRMQNYNYTSSNWPRSIECQMLQGDAGDAFSIQQVTFDAKVNSKGEWDPTGRQVSVCQYGCDGRNFYSNPDSPDFPGPKWNDMEVVVRGSDSAIHIVNGKEVFKLFNIRITDNQKVDLIPWGNGAVGLEAEDAIVHYRRWEIMELPKSGPNFLQRLLLDGPNTAVQYSAGTNATLTWKTVGSIPKVNVFYNMGDGQGWIKTGDNLTNTGSYVWKVPGTNSQKLRLKVSADAWVAADSSKGDNFIISGAGIGLKKPNPEFKQKINQPSAISSSGILDIQGRRMHNWLHNSLQFLFSDKQ